MSLSSAIQWWEEWKLRILVLGSLFLHLLLPWSLLVRRFPKLHKLRVLIWIAYIGSDALAIYGLATLFNRYQQRTRGGDDGSSNLELFWAPVLLVHLGGHHWITAYSLEDNELWRRHAMTAVSQITVALYVFCKWWSGEKMLLEAAVLLFVAGILNFMQKPLALRRASFNTMQATTDESPQGGGGGGGGGCIGRCWIWCNTPYVEKPEKNGEKLCLQSLEDYVQKAKLQSSVEDSNQNQEKEIDTCLSAHLNDTRKKFVDLQVPYSNRIKVMKSFLKLDDDHAYHMIQTFLGSIFRLLYTKLVYTPLDTCIVTLPMITGLASMALFFKAPKNGYNKKDVWVTYIVFCCTALQYLFSEVINSLIYHFWKQLFSWQAKVHQHNFLSYCAREKQPALLMKLVSASGDLTQYVNKHWYTWQVGEAIPVTKLVRSHVLDDGWKRCIHDSASYRRFNNLRGQQTLWRYHQLDKMGWTLDLPFDYSVLIWHIATDLCFHYSRTSPQQGGGEGDSLKHGMVISNHMVYLLLTHPEMLMIGTRQSLFMVASNEVQDILKCTSSWAPLDTEERIALEIKNATARAVPTTSESETATAQGAIPDACKLAEALMSLSNETERWQVILGVWVEMLCYSAARCRGYLHAKSLGEGGEFLSTVWLLWSCMGMETLAEMNQKQDHTPIEEKDAGGA
jgi:hypothetical protein